MNAISTCIAMNNHTKPWPVMPIPMHNTRTAANELGRSKLRKAHARTLGISRRGWPSCDNSARSLDEKVPLAVLGAVGA
jgi:hypothetical protein